jgi:hypothetical protein
MVDIFVYFLYTRVAPLCTFLMMLGHGSTFDRPNSLPAQGEVQESQSPGTSQAPSLRDLVSNPRRKDLGLEFESEISESRDL